MTAVSSAKHATATASRASHRRRIIQASMPISCISRSALRRRGEARRAAGSRTSSSPSACDLLGEVHEPRGGLAAALRAARLRSCVVIDADRAARRAGGARPRARRCRARRCWCPAAFRRAGTAARGRPRSRSAASTIALQPRQRRHEVGQAELERVLDADARLQVARRQLQRRRARPARRPARARRSGRWRAAACSCPTCSSR